jgi:sulfoxide reductase heme-binding subunit YedZ
MSRSVRTGRSAQPLGGTSGDQTLRLIRDHVPLALASAAVLIAFMTLPQFDPRAYPSSDMSSGSAFPRQRIEGASTDQASPMPSASHGGQPSPAAHTAVPTTGPGHAGAQPAPTGHGGTQPAPTDHVAGQPASTGHGAEDRFTLPRLTTATGYVATALLAITLLIGPLNLLLRRRDPVSSYLRRDVGMWTALFSVVHVFLGLQVHSASEISRFLSYFVASDGRPLLNSFGLGNWTGLVATVIVVGLLTISSDLALRTLKAGTWKWLQRLNYVLFAMVVAHAFFYGALLRLTSPFTVLLFLSVITVLVGQLLGVWLWRRRRYARSATAAA